MELYSWELGVLRGSGPERPPKAPKLAPVIDHPTRARRPRYKTLKSTLGRSERDMLVVLRRKLAAQIDSDEIPGHALAQLVRQFLNVATRIQSIDARADEEAAAADEPRARR